MSQQDVDSGVPTTPAASPDSIELQATSDANGAAEEGMQTPPVRERDLFGGSLADPVRASATARMLTK